MNDLKIFVSSNKGVVLALTTIFSINGLHASELDDPLRAVIENKIQPVKAITPQVKSSTIKVSEIKPVNKIAATTRNSDNLEKIIQTVASDSATNRPMAKDPIVLAVDKRNSSNSQWSSYLNSSVKSRSAMVLNDRTGEVLYQKNSNTQVSLASISKLMAAMVFLDAKQNMYTPITITEEDVDHLKNSGSRLTVGTTLTREELLHIGLMSSENRAIHALSRNYPGGKTAFVNAMNVKAKQIGMTNSIFYEPTGLNPGNKSTASDIIKMAKAADKYPLIRHYTTDQQTQVRSKSGKMLTYKNSNSLVRSGEWVVGLQKTGYIKEAGRCMVVKSKFSGDDVYLVFLGAPSSYSRVSDAEQVREVFAGRYY